MRYVDPTPDHKRRAAEKLEQFSITQLFVQLENGDSYSNPFGGFQTLINY